MRLSVMDVCILHLETHKRKVERLNSRRLALHHPCALVPSFLTLPKVTMKRIMDKRKAEDIEILHPR